MTITAQTSKTGPYNGNGTTTVFSYTFEVQDEAHLVVTLADASGVETVQVLNVDYTVSGVGNPNGGQITMSTAPVVGYTLTISRSVPLTQEVDLESRRSIAPEVLEDAYDKLTQIAQDFDLKLEQSFRVSTSQGTGATQLTSSVSGPALLGFDAADNLTTYSLSPSGVVNLASNVNIVDAGNYYAGSDVEAALQEAAQADTTVYTPAGSGAVDRTVQSRLRDYVSVKDFGAVGDGVTDDTAAFNLAWAAADPQAVFVPKGSYAITGSLTGQFFSVGGVTIVGGSIDLSIDVDASGNLDGLVTPAGEASQIALSSAVRPAAGMGRGRVNYYSNRAVEVIVPTDIIMGGFRFMGQYKKARAPVYGSGVPFRAVVDFGNDLGAETAVTPHNWYAVFACANDGDTNVTYKLIPFLRVGSVAGSTATLCSVKENTFTVLPVTYSWDGGNDSLADVDCLVINEGTSNRFSGRIAKITANTATTVTLDTIGSVNTFDYLLPAPPGFDHYVYLCTTYLETSVSSPVGVEARNIADSGVIVMARNVNNADPNWVDSGAVAGPPGVKLTWASQISPLATGVCFSPTIPVSTSANGTINLTCAHDGGNHDVARVTMYKSTEAASVAQQFNITLTFSTGQFMYYWVSGGLAPQRTASFLLNTGWIEP